MAANPHEVLGVEEDASEDSVKKRYKRVSKMFHPDKHDQDPSSKFFFQMIVDAYTKIKRSREKIELPRIEDKRKKEKKEKDLELERDKRSQEKTKLRAETPVIVPGTNITENDIRILGEQIKDPWFQQPFELTDFFGDVAIPENKKKDMRPKSSRA